MHCADTVHALKNIKNESHSTIYTFKNYFATVFSVFSFQFSVSATINSIQTDPKNRDHWQQFTVLLAITLWATGYMGIRQTMKET